MLRRVLLIIMLVMTVAFCGIAVQAEDQEYIFQIRQDLTLFSQREMENARAVYAPEGVYVTDDKGLLAELEAAGLLEYCEPSGKIYLQGFAEQGREMEQLSWNRSLVGYSYGAEKSITGKGVRVAVIDSGFSDPNEEFKFATIEQGINFLEAVDSETRFDTTDTYGHGTNVTRMIASTEIGLAPEVTVIPFKCFDAGQGDVPVVVEAIYAATDLYDCDVINLSLGSQIKFTSLVKAVNHALENGVIVVAAAGNLYENELSQEQNRYRYPAAQEGVIGVSAVWADKRAGIQSARNDSVFVAAPGFDIPCIRPDTGEAYFDGGTSFAAPVVSAAAALALSQNPNLTGEEFAALLAKTAEDRGAEGYDIVYGHGLINVGLLLAVQREDTTGFSLSLDDGGICTSGWVPMSTEETYSAVVAAYDQNNRFCSSVVLENRSGDLLLNNVPISEKTEYYKVFFLGKDTLGPVSEPVQYQR